MAIALPQSVRKLLENKAYGHVITWSPKGKTQLTMVWMDVDGDTALFNTSEGRLKPRNLRNNPKIMVSVQDHANPQSYLLIEGTATLTHDGAQTHIDKLAKRFLGMDKYPWLQPGEQRVIVKIAAERLSGAGPGMQPWA